MTIAEAIANVETIQHDVDTYLAVPVLNDHQRKDLATDLRTLSHNLGELKALLAAPAAAPATPTLTFPVAASSDGMTNDAAARFDAAAVFQLSLGNADDMKNNPHPGAAKALGYSGVMGDSATKKYGVFKNGELVETTTTVPDAGWGFPFGYAEGIDPEAPFVP